MNTLTDDSCRIQKSQTLCVCVLARARVCVRVCVGLGVGGWVDGSDICISYNGYIPIA